MYIKRKVDGLKLEENLDCTIPYQLSCTFKEGNLELHRHRRSFLFPMLHHSVVEHTYICVHISVKMLLCFCSFDLFALLRQIFVLDALTLHYLTPQSFCV